jgi:hypothetical protein
MELAKVPPISKVYPNSLPFRRGLGKAYDILVGTGLGTYSNHYHPEMKVKPGYVVFEELISPDELALYPLLEEEAAKRGRPSCWAADSRSGEAGVLRYADNRLHERSGIDVTSRSFLDQLVRSSKAFVEQGLHSILTINVANLLFSPGEGNLTCEETLEGIQKVTIIRTPREVLDDRYLLDPRPLYGHVTSHGTLHQPRHRLSAWWWRR